MTQLAPAKPIPRAIPRDPVDPSCLKLQGTVYETPRGLIEATLNPGLSELTILRHYGRHSGSWTFDLATQQEGTFRPLCMVGGESQNLFLAGTIRETSESIIYSFDLDWNGADPKLTPKVLYRGSAFGDVVSIANVKELNGSLVDFDFSHASLAYLRISDGTITPIASYPQYPELIQVFGLSIDYYKADPIKGFEAGVWITLQPGQEVEHVPSTGTFTVNVVDDLGDGVLEEYWVD
ncbi:MAG: hypothetical protein DWQ01_17400 [Planctomycetota bacterium]|nr:MAG: hypothetical protein DWQ01_17400 [Planctomycetota bacterium]